MTYGFGFFERRGLSRSLRRLVQLGDQADKLPPAEVKALHDQLGTIRHQLDRARMATGAALLAIRDPEDGIDRPDQCDWAFRPRPWRAPLTPVGAVSVPSPCEIGGGVKLFHDSRKSELSWRQTRNTGPGHIAPFALILDVYRFDGSFMSLVQDLPMPAVTGLTLNHMIKVGLQAELESPLEIYARLNVQHGPNCEQLVRQFAFDGNIAIAEFDLAYTRINEKRVEKIWLDLIFEAPQMNQVILRDMTVARAPRADV